MMHDAETVALMRAVLDSLCKGISQYETSIRIHVASRLLEAAGQGERSEEGLWRVGRNALGERTAESEGSL